MKLVAETSGCGNWIEFRAESAMKISRLLDVALIRNGPEGEPFCAVPVKWRGEVVRRVDAEKIELEIDGRLVAYGAA